MGSFNRYFTKWQFSTGKKKRTYGERSNAESTTYSYRFWERVPIVPLGHKCPQYQYRSTVYNLPDNPRSSKKGAPVAKD